MRKVCIFLTGLLGIFLFILIDRPLGANSRKKSVNSPSINVTTFQLSNGLKVILAPLDNVEAACVMLYHLTGARDDPPGSRGISHLYQVLMLAGTQNLDAMDRVNVIKKYGGSTDSSVNYDNSVFCQMIPESEINNALWFESERISSLKLEEQVIDRLKEIEYKRFQRLNTTNPHFRAVNWVKSKVFEGTVYQTPKYGNMEKIAGFSNRKIREVYDNFRNLSDIIVVISGKFNEVTIKDAVNKRFSGLSPGKRQRKQVYDDTVAPRSEYVYENRMEKSLRQPFVLYGIRAPSKKKPAHINFDLIRYYLVDKRISKLERQLKHRNNLDVTISHQYTGNIEANALIIEINAVNRLDLEKAKYIITREFSALVNKPISNSDLKMVKTLMEIDFKKNIRDLKTRALLLAESYHLNGTIDFVEPYLRHLRKINSYDINRTAKTYLKKENLVVFNVYKNK